MENKKRFSRDLYSVMGSNILILVSSIATGFVVPKVLGVTGYGLYKIFTLYLSYSALMHLGFVDGILLTFAGKSYEELPKEKFRKYTQIFFVFQLMVAAIIIIIALLFLDTEYKIIIIMLGVDILAVNMTAYYQYISQSTMRFTELSLRKIILAICKMLLVCAMLLFYKLNMHVLSSVYFYIGGIVFIDVCLVGWYAWSYRDLAVGERASFRNCKNDICSFFKQGIVLTIAFQAAMVIFSLDRQFVSVLFDTETYGIYSFAYNIISMVTTVISAVSFVLFPRLKQLKTEAMMETFSKAMAWISIVSVAAMMGYQPLCLIIKFVLPEYVDSIDYLRIIIPGLAMSCCINIVMFTYYKALNKHFIYFKVCCGILVLSSLLNYLAYIVGGTPIYISLASVISLLIWYIVGEHYFIKIYKVTWKKNLLYVVISMTVFYMITGLKNDIFSWLLFIVFYSGFTIIIYKEEVMGIGNTIKRRLIK